MEGTRPGTSMNAHNWQHQTTCGMSTCTCDQCGNVCSGTDAIHVLHTHAGQMGMRGRQGVERNFHQSDRSKHTVNHNCERNFQCDDCGKEFNDNHKYKRHILTHTGERNFKCEECGKRFTRSDKLTRHFLIHTGERKFQCEECGKRFIRKDKLQRHVLTHTGEKNFQCEECGKQFLRKDKLKAHMLTHTGVRN